MKSKTAGTWSDVWHTHTNLPQESQESVEIPGQAGTNGDGEGRASGL